MSPIFQSPGISSVGTYQISGRPWITGSTHMVTSSYGVANAEHKIEFPAVTKSFTIINKGDCSLRVHFASQATQSVITFHHYITLTNQEDSLTADVRCTNLYVSLASYPNTGSFEIMAELTGIARESMHNLTGSGIDTFID